MEKAKENPNVSTHMTIWLVRKERGSNDEASPLF